jgi:putative pyruvate formate lyase activating enzyme
MQDAVNHTENGFRPSYLDEGCRKSFPEKIRWARDQLRYCRACPRQCGADRASGRPGDCRIAAQAVVSSAYAHHGEEYCLSGCSGSGTLFFSSCNLHCVFCQNWAISQRVTGHRFNPQQLAALMLKLQVEGCHNINLVSPGHVLPQLVEALILAIGQGLALPVVYNTNAYDSVDSLAQLEGLIDIYMPDFKCWKPETARRLLGAEDYPEIARRSIAEMHRQVGDLKLGQAGLACRGLILRQLVLPGLAEESIDILFWLAREISRDTFVNIMDQYHPDHLVGRIGPDGNRAYPDIDRRTFPAEIAGVFQAARSAGLWRFSD